MTVEEGYAWDRLRFQLEIQIGFWFGLVAGNDPHPREQLRGAAEAWCQENGQKFRFHAVSPAALAALAIELAQGAPPGLHWIRADGPLGLIDEWEAAAAQLLLAMNERREAYRQRLDGGVVLEGRASLKRLLRELAPDLFSIRSFLIEPDPSPSIPELERPEWRVPELSLAEIGASGDPDRELARAAQLAGDQDFDARMARLTALLRAILGLIRREFLDEAELVLSQYSDFMRDLESELPPIIKWFHYPEQYLEGIICAKRGKLHAALEHYDRALHLAKLPGAIHLDLEAVIHTERSIVLHRLGELPRAIDEARKAVSSLELLATEPSRPKNLSSLLVEANRRVDELLLEMS